MALLGANHALENLVTFCAGATALVDGAKQQASSARIYAKRLIRPAWHPCLPPPILPPCQPHPTRSYCPLIPGVAGWVLCTGVPRAWHSSSPSHPASRSLPRTPLGERSLRPGPVRPGAEAVEDQEHPPGGGGLGHRSAGAAPAAGALHPLLASGAAAVPAPPRSLPAASHASKRRASVPRLSLPLPHPCWDTPVLQPGEASGALRALPGHRGRYRGGLPCSPPVRTLGSHPRTLPGSLSLRILAPETRF